MTRFPAKERAQEGDTLEEQKWSSDLPAGEVIEPAHLALLAKQREAVASLDDSIKVLECAQHARFDEEVARTLEDLQTARRRIASFVPDDSNKAANLVDIGGRLQNHADNLSRQARYSNIVSQIWAPSPQNSRIRR